MALEKQKKAETEKKKKSEISAKEMANGERQWRRNQWHQ